MTAARMSVIFSWLSLANNNGMTILTQPMLGPGPEADTGVEHNETAGGFQQIFDSDYCIRQTYAPRAMF